MHDETPEPSEEELRAAFEAQLRQVSVEDVILQTVATLVNLGARRRGLIPEPGDDPGAVRDIPQAQLAIEGARALAPLCPEDNQYSIRQALSQLKMSFAREAQAAPGGGAEPPPPARAGDAPSDSPSQPAPDDASEADRARARSKSWTPPGA